MSTCPDCKCQFVQPFTCVTCGAEKLYDVTVLRLQAENERLRAAMTLAMGAEGCAVVQCHAHKLLNEALSEVPK